MSFKQMNEDIVKFLFEDSIEQISSIADELNDTKSEQKNLKTSTESFKLKTSDYDYAYDIELKLEETKEVNDYNNPDAYAKSVETWICNGKPAMKCIHNRELDGPSHPDAIEIIDEQGIYNLLISLGTQSGLFDAKNVTKGN